MHTQRKAVFLDRDGTLNRDTGYMIRFEDFEVLPGVESALHILQDLNYRLFVVTNQSGVARGFFTREAVEDLHRRVREFFTSRGIHLEDIVYCPHHPEGADPAFTRDCQCRKPKPGMILHLQEKYDLDLAQSYVVGDKRIDAQTGANAGATGIWLHPGPQVPVDRVDNPENIKEFVSLLDFAESLREFDGRK